MLLAPYGELRLVGGKLNAELRGIALMVSHWFPQFWTAEVVRQLACSWNVNIVRECGKLILKNIFLSFRFGQQWASTLAVICRILNENSTEWPLWWMRQLR
jgi:hypothetical protein